MRNRKETAWKKSRKFGDVKGGRVKAKMADKIYGRRHNLLPPDDKQNLPIFIVDNPSRDFFFPVTVEEIRSVVRSLPKQHTEQLTHIWLRKISKKNYENSGAAQASFICGSGVNLIVLYPFPADLKMRFGGKKPSKKVLKLFTPYASDLHQEKEQWFLKWTEHGIKQYFLEHLLLHEIGHHIDSVYKRYWSKTYKTRAENFADNYARVWLANLQG